MGNFNSVEFGEFVVDGTVYFGYNNVTINADNTATLSIYTFDNTSFHDLTSNAIIDINIDYLYSLVITPDYYDNNGKMLSKIDIIQDQRLPSLISNNIVTPFTELSLFKKLNNNEYEYTTEIESNISDNIYFFNIENNNVDYFISSDLLDSTGRRVSNKLSINHVYHINSVPNLYDIISTIQFNIYSTAYNFISNYVIYNITGGRGRYNGVYDTMYIENYPLYDVSPSYDKYPPNSNRYITSTITIQHYTNCKTKTIINRDSTIIYGDEYDITTTLHDIQFPQPIISSIDNFLIFTNLYGNISSTVLTLQIGNELKQLSAFNNRFIKSYFLPSVIPIYKFYAPEVDIYIPFNSIGSTLTGWYIYTDYERTNLIDYTYINNYNLSENVIKINNLPYNSTYHLTKINNTNPTELRTTVFNYSSATKTHINAVDYYMNKSNIEYTDGTAIIRCVICNTESNNYYLTSNYIDQLVFEDDDIEYAITPSIVYETEYNKCTIYPSGTNKYIHKKLDIYYRVIGNGYHDQELKHVLTNCPVVFELTNFVQLSYYEIESYAVCQDDTSIISSIYNKIFIKTGNIFDATNDGVTFTNNYLNVKLIDGYDNIQFFNMSNSRYINNINGIYNSELQYNVALNSKDIDIFFNGDSITNNKLMSIYYRFVDTTSNMYSNIFDINFTYPQNTLFILGTSNTIKNVITPKYEFNYNNNINYRYKSTFGSGWLVNNPYKLYSTGIYTNKFKFTLLPNVVSYYISTVGGSANWGNIINLERGRYIDTIDNNNNIFSFNYNGNISSTTLSTTSNSIKKLYNFVYMNTNRSAINKYGIFYLYGSPTPYDLHMKNYTIMTGDAIFYIADDDMIHSLNNVVHDYFGDLENTDHTIASHITEYIELQSNIFTNLTNLKKIIYCDTGVFIAITHDNILNVYCTNRGINYLGQGIVHTLIGLNNTIIKNIVCKYSYSTHMFHILCILHDGTLICCSDKTNMVNNDNYKDNILYDEQLLHPNQQMLIDTIDVIYRDLFSHGSYYASLLFVTKLNVNHFSGAPREYVDNISPIQYGNFNSYGINYTRDNNVSYTSALYIDKYNSTVSAINNGNITLYSKNRSISVTSSGYLSFVGTCNNQLCCKTPTNLMSHSDVYDVYITDTDIYYINARDFKVYCSGTSVTGQLETARTLTNIVQLHGSVDHLVGLQKDGSVIGCGNTALNKLDVSLWTDIIQVVATNYATFGLKNDGSVVLCGTTSLPYEYDRVEKWGNVTSLLVSNDNVFGIIKGQMFFVMAGDMSKYTDLIHKRNVYSVMEYLDTTLVTYNELDIIREPVHFGDNTFDQDSFISGINIYNIDRVISCRNLSCINDIYGNNYISGKNSELLDSTIYNSIKCEWYHNVSSGDSHIAINRMVNNKVLSYGDNTFGQCDTTAWSDITNVECGLNYTIGLKCDGSVVACGNNTNGQCDTTALIGVSKISCGDSHTVGLLSIGTVVACGNNTNGQCDTATYNNITDISCGSNHTVMLDYDNTAYAIGDNTFGQCNVSGWNDIKEIYTCDNVTIGLRLNGEYIACGDNSNGLCNVENYSDMLTISCGSNHVIGIKYIGYPVNDSYLSCY